MPLHGTGLKRENLLKTINKKRETGKPEKNNKNRKWENLLKNNKNWKHENM